MTVSAAAETRQAREPKRAGRRITVVRLSRALLVKDHCFKPLLGRSRRGQLSCQ